MVSSERSARGLEDLWDMLARQVFLTLFLHEVKLGFKSRLLQAWIGIVMFFGFFFVLLGFTDPTTSPTNSIVILMFFFGFFGSMIAMVLASSSISGEVGGIADSLLSKAVQRWEYVLAKYVSHSVTALIVYFLMAGLSVMLFWAADRFPDDLDWFNLGVLIGLIALVLVFFSSIGVMFSSMASRTVFSFLMGILVWFAFIFLFLIFGWDTMYSPVNILQNAERIIAGTWNVDWARLVSFYLLAPMAFFTTSMVFFYNRDL